MKVKKLFKDKNKLLFIGDSITEWGRHEDQEDIGTGYVRIVHDYLKVSYPNKEWDIYNRGVGGDRIIDLKKRWNEDVVELDPDIISVSIGINDVWRQLDHPELEQVDPQLFEQIYRELLETIKDKQIVLMEPTIIEEDIQAEGNVKLKKYVAVIHKLAEEFEATVVHTHEQFIAYLQSTHKQLVTIDGVHMNSIGNMLMAKTWITAVL
jgi:acyl-CoA thioesterase I